ncbi:LysM peptidoglycan-binding domain-containing M23 family metallopeptidase [Jannaschia sp. M317]|uniref:LysM peptidoglycan-binding domain-containing M23 family metallopeptidase n=1 Tax=Jannaschia sp. M317 TaxID=2867011 RepID=UPI0021A27715|nr:LysM peptidoglycan-binding domain-containing M23 family metallopeptidase [Jannaschia sp. M317]UWQ17034.1 LysM peptidoglycan-binding domain-containing M23 family metallopeptidase [Jannaschia sp. M317]
MSQSGRMIRVAGLMTAIGVLAGCNGIQGLDLDLRNNAPGGLDTSDAARRAAADRPAPDANGLITYPNYQVAVARRGDTVADVAQRVGIGSAELATFNGLQVDSRLNAGAVLALPRRINPAAAAATERPDITQIAGAAIDRAAGAAPAAAPVAVQTGQEPVRHRVARGETAFSISRLYGVSPASLAEWNGLGADFTIREGQFLLIPLVIGDSGAEEIASPGNGTPTPVPPSASSALPESVEAATLPESPNLDQFRTEASAEPEPEAIPVAPTPEPAPEPARLRRPVSGDVLRPFSARNEGVDFRATEGAPVSAAAAGTVAAITRDTDQVPILVLRHDGGLLTVYANIKDIAVSKGDSIRAGQRLASVGGGDPAFLHFEVRRGFDAVDPEPLLR